MPYKRTGITALFSVQGTCSGTCLFLCRWNGQGTLACPAGAPFLGKKWGKEPQREEVLPSGLPSLVGWCGGRLYFSLVTWPAALTAKGS